MLLGIGAIFMISFGISSIFSNRYQIGVIKSLGGSTTDIGKIFVLKAFVVSLITSIVSVIASIITLPFADKLLIKTFETITGREAFSLIVIATKPELLTINVIAVIAMFAISALIALISLRRIKPANIIKARE